MKEILEKLNKINSLSEYYNETNKFTEIYPLGKMKQHQIDRGLFIEIFKSIEDAILEMNLPYESSIFKMWLYDEEFYILEKESGTIVNWYKLYHTGRAHECNRTMTEEEYRIFARLLELDLKETGVIK